jgi:ketohexokinase
VILVCTWGAQGAAAVKLDEESDKHEWARCSETWHPPGEPDARVVDTIGAGDTFIAGMLFSLTHHSETTLEQKLRYAVQIASRKVYQDGFDRLGRAMQTP